ncbi:MAG: DUF2281 domain-containing protein [Synechococcales cyanobacterium T60_A2020_003]|nr:DUF2281 domain-containing protein [Synechococcales cyanobacterium T60_A2020_003]
MIQIAQLQRDIEALPQEAQSLLVDFVDLLKRRYSTEGADGAGEEKQSNFEKFEQVGLIGCCDVEEHLSVSYKSVLAESLEAKYDHR